MIPRTLHQIWIGPDPLPEEFAQYSLTWEKHHPDWVLMLWTDENRPHLINEHMYLRAEEIAPKSPWQFRADVLRYELLYQLGGLYVDADMECLKNIESLIGDAELFAGWEKDGVWVGNTIIGAIPQHPFIRSLIDGLAVNIRRNKGRAPNRLSGPQYLTRLYFELKPSAKIVDAKYLYPYLYDELHRENENFPEAFTRHVWNNRRKRLAHV